MWQKKENTARTNQQSFEKTNPGFIFHQTSIDTAVAFP